ncbi:cupin domain-containing protein [Blastococcus deserti]|uniref:Zinc finger protein n=1 Tax=Blastococcus deserti TaxID=2259033 RepID=A0ABW4XF12_9ACTN
MSTSAHDAMGAWHVDPALLGRYASGTLGGSAAVSVETHVLGCASCRAALVPAVDPARLSALWVEVVDRIDAPRPTPVERLLVRLGVHEATARLIAAAPSLTVSWLGSLGLALLFAVLASDAGDKGLLLFLALAPVLPVAGVAAAYGRGVDPTYDVGAAAPYSTFRLLLLRSSAVLASSLLLIGTGAVLLPVDGWLAAAWLLPSLALTATTLAASTRVQPAVAAGVVVAAWLLAVLTAARSTGSAYAAFGGNAQLACTTLLVLSVLVLVHRGRTAADPQERS